MASNKLGPRWQRWSTIKTGGGSGGYEFDPNGTPTKGRGGYSPLPLDKESRKKMRQAIRKGLPPKDLKEFEKLLRKQPPNSGVIVSTKKPNHFTPKRSKRKLKVEKVKENKFGNFEYQDRQKIRERTEYVHHLEWSERWEREYGVKLRPQVNQASDFNRLIEDYRDRRFSDAVLNMLSKYSEDQLGADVYPGTEFWDMDSLLDRVMTKVPIYNCMKDREYEKVVLILDTSPSCSQQAIWYGKLAKAAASAQLIEMYDGPNAYITRKWDCRKEKFVEFLDFSTIIDEKFSRWKLFNKRHIIFFGDHDGADIVCKAANKNTVHWFCRDQEISEWMFEDKPYIRKNLITHKKISTKKDFINAIRKLR
jgi:hypothetical protein